MTKENYLFHVPEDMEAGSYLVGYAQAVHDLGKDDKQFRREAAKDILVAAIKADDEREVIFEDKNFPCYVRQSIKLADELIKQLKEK